MSPDRHGGDCFNDVVAPIKRMRLIQGAGHFAEFMQPDEFLRATLRGGVDIVEVRPGVRCELVALHLRLHFDYSPPGYSGADDRDRKGS